MSELPKSLLKQKKAIISGPDADKVHQQGSFGELEKGRLSLSDVEILFLLEREKILLYDDSGKLLAFPEAVALLSKNDHEMWVRYLLYSDLRRRGYIVKPGYGPKLEYRVYRRGAIVGKEPAKYLVYGLVEGKTIGISELTSISNSAKLSKKDLILAVIDRQGEIAYYEASEITF
ncbi:MAG: tRNA-intron lyase [Candidatus Methanomethyliaceae archaeon]|nr:tRNA-intron lyase [Candidatus Methanomethyliaceae archaeon]MDD1766588.1 tRNA-intron lyase [Candidatus Methanomethyliaceae archaeon]